MGIVDKFRRYARFRHQFCTLRRESIASGRSLPLLWNQRRAFLYDDTPFTSFDRHYVYHPAWAARILADTKPAYHVDISSTLHFCTIVSAFVPVRFYDVRPAQLSLTGLVSEEGNLTSLPFESGSISSLSCMHVVEHVGLGRYGDKLDATGDLKAMAELKRVLAPGGDLLFVVPVGQPRIVFNAHRIYAYADIVKSFADMELKQFALIPDDPEDGGLVLDASEKMADGQLYGCGCFWFKKHV